MLQLPLKWRFSYSTYKLCRQFSSKTGLVEEGDVVLLRRKRYPLADPILTRPLRKDSAIRPVRRDLDFKGTLPHSSIIGKRVRDVVETTQGNQFRIHEPSLAEYITLSPRLVTPIYPRDANILVFLLDLNPTSYTQGDSEAPFEIFEAGTGHGSLTLHLSRAIHAANAHPPTIPPLMKKSERVSKKNIVQLQSIAEQDVDSQKPGEEQSITTSPLDSSTDVSEEEQSVTTNQLDSSTEVSEIPIDEQGDEEEYTEEMQAEYERWLRTRRAIIQTLDISAKHSEHAQRIVRSYRQGLYYGNINFHVSTIQEYLSKRLDNESEPFLQHAILDLPESHSHMEIVGKCLKPNGILLLYCPNITQINESVRLVKKHKLPFLLESVLEIGGTSGGRPWDVKMVKPRAMVKTEALEKQKSKDELSVTDKDANEVDDGQEIPDKEGEMCEKDETAGWDMVCHPKFGDRITVVAFVAIWRRMEI